MSESAASNDNEGRGHALHMQDDGAARVLPVPLRQEEVKSAATVDFTVTASVPVAALREEFNALVAEGYAGSWRHYLGEQRKTFREYASGWWTLDEVTYV